MENTTIKEIPIPRLIDDSHKTREEFISEMELAFEQIKNGEVYTMEEVMSELTKTYGTKF